MSELVKYAAIRISEAELFDVLAGRLTVSGVPPSAKYISIHHNFGEQCVYLKFEHTDDRIGGGRKNDSLWNIDCTIRPTGLCKCTRLVEYWASEIQIGECCPYGSDGKYLAKSNCPSCGGTGRPR